MKKATNTEQFFQENRLFPSVDLIKQELLVSKIQFQIKRRILFSVQLEEVTLLYTADIK